MMVTRNEILKQSGTWVIDAAREWPECEFVRDHYVSEHERCLSKTDNKGRIRFSERATTFEGCGPVDIQPYCMGAW